MQFDSSSREGPLSRSFDGELDGTGAEKLVNALKHVQTFFLPRKEQKELDEKLAAMKEQP